jgi:hypothetical protein
LTTDVKPPKAAEPAPRSLEPEAPFVSGVRGADGNWVPVPQLADANATYIPEAPADGVIYGRRGSDETWRPLTVLINETLEGDGDGVNEPLGVAPAAEDAPGILSVPKTSALTLTQIATIPPARSVNMTLGLDTASGQDVLDGIDDIHPITPAALHEALTGGWDVLDDRFVNVDGDTMTADLTIETDLHVEGYAFAPLAPTDDEHLVNKRYVDTRVTGTLTLIGTFDASTGQVTFSYASGVPNGPLPPADASNLNEYVIVSLAGLPPIGPPETQIICQVGDWWVSDGTEWLYLPIGGTQTAAINVTLIPAVFGADNVQTALEAAEAITDALDGRVTVNEGEIADLDGRVTVVEGEVTGKVAKTGDTMTGPLTLDSVPNINSGGQLAYAASGTARFGMGAEQTGLQRFLIAAINAGQPSTVMAIDNTGMVQVFNDLTLDRLPSQPGHATMRFYVDQQDDQRVAKAGDTMQGLLTLAVQPQGAMDAATKIYVDQIATGARLIIGIIDGTNGRCIYSGASGLPPGPLVDASTVPSGSDVICSVAGTIPPDPLLPPEVWNMTLAVGDVLVSNGANWILIHIARAPITASGVAVIPNVFGANNVQSALEQAERQDMPPGGDVGQVLAKRDIANYAAEWIDPPTGGLTPEDDLLYLKQIGYMAFNIDGLRPSMGYTQGAVGLPGGANGRWQIHTFNASDPPGGTINTSVIQELWYLGTNSNTVVSKWVRVNNGPGWSAWQQQILSPADVAGNFVSKAGDTMSGTLNIYPSGAGVGLEILASGGLRLISQNAGSFSLINRNADNLAVQHTTAGVPNSLDMLTLSRPGGVNPLALFASAVVIDGFLTAASATFAGTASAAEPTANEHLATKRYVDQLVSGAPILIGVIDAGTGNCIFADTTVGPVPAPTGSRHYIICTTPGTIPNGPASGLLMRLGDEIFDADVNGTPTWVLIAVGTGGITTTADQVALVPNVAGANNVQAGMQVLNTNKVEKAGDVMSGRLRFWSSVPAVAPPATGTGSSNGTRLQLYGSDDSYALGIESGNMWLNAGGFKFYNGATLRYTFASNGATFTVPATFTSTVFSDQISLNGYSNIVGGSIVWRDSGGRPHCRITSSGTASGQNDARMSFNIWAGGYGYQEAFAIETNSPPRVRFRGPINVGGQIDGGGPLILTGNAANLISVSSDSQKYFDFRRGNNSTVRWRITGGNANDDVYELRANTNAGTFDRVFYQERQSWNAWFYGNVSVQSLTQRSDVRLKTEVKAFSAAEAAAAFEHLNPVRYRQRAKPGYPVDVKALRWGFVADEIEEGAPDAISTDLDGVKGYDVAQVLAISVAKIKALEAEIAELKKRLH